MVRKEKQHAETGKPEKNEGQVEKSDEEGVRKERERREREMREEGEGEEEEHCESLSKAFAAVPVNKVK